ncbi:MAG: 3-deoxy-manno-octulosonate cytidylyltransferase [Gammaproteobacteria bacterium]|nr:3-deoxy-manno-octulosonate cytidylyltransferase [Gammaproteobacteria bacterium]
MGDGAEGFVVVIPARYQSERLPGKPLADICGKPMIVRVAERAAAAGAEQVIVATDDERIRAAVVDAGHTAMLTRADHGSGSDRVMEVAAARGWADDAIVVNVQGDEPLIPPAVIGQVAGCLAADPQLPSATLCETIDDAETLHDPNVVKVVRQANGLAMYFSRAPIPFDRERGERRDGLTRIDSESWMRHVGIYGYRLATLRRFVTLPPSRLELLEKLEQLRLLENGIGLLVERASAPVPAGVDTPADLERVRDLLTS